DNKFLSGVSMMPLLPYISDTTESLHQMFSTFKQAEARYVLPATLTLFGNGRADSKALTLRAVSKHYPHLLPKYEQFFKESEQMPAYYQKAFYSKMKELCMEYGIRNRIV